ncbi:DUF4184 family protein [Clostridium ganghwense]|uniref:DUF4184 family protein n=1 Tax=Clostridium ganghwense TaxID=312089 RepID=A0ABT4CTG1_9CLOT|nr:DUF4184 family protein [Clostridium ganghwense]MCY6371486.1 DUF4184 family protein [Clostridium ganghwense]
MPFTFTHPAIVIPVKKKWTSLFCFTALVIGSMAPDFEYFIRFIPIGTMGHTAAGFFYLNLPLCLLIAYIFHYIVKKPFIINLPNPIDKWYYSFAVERWGIKSIRDFIVFTYSALIGMASHVFWDSFTHKTGFFVNMFSLLRKPIYIMNHKIPVYKFLQHGSTLIGMMIILIYLYKIRNTKEIILSKIFTKNKIIYHSSILLIAVLTVLYRMFYTLGGFSLRYFGVYIVSFISGLIIGIIIVSILQICFIFFK